MTLNKSHSYLSPEEYLEAEKSSPIKHEYIQGKIYAMAGASDAHVTITANLVALLRNHIRGTGCRIYVADMKARIESLDIFYYPDIMVTCDSRDTQFEYFKRYPSLIIEVLSPSTEALDRGDKFSDYQELDTLQEYVLVSQNRQRIDCFRRNSEGRWVLYSYRGNQQLELTSVNFSCSLTDVYEDVTFPTNLSK
ncbi:Uma2 family endonuclease [Dolichospermum sp. ST_con]|nr:Uma2 family endonuclease [Dolichospermum sp. ST_con]MDD1422646.1 Uma2 family endonuclease [Dolichospermum sp. ST_sed1]MDD1426028.1 Uma2 family endonuclease [Dolichospermum sp. ST_sed9]MDD1432155.1 Uma2 family endonuclease [Dolichospermum sp. ST_sed6]MDD1438275.1 Uma2 family endonuclease [Dolichospermum sp. ST_sed10]MDD1441106.1 Uma2 family endonuclease [Dolichospermum sp. ST_sed3]MDD1449067.1 Uma2 family endonuclease [Dolichospermum sp. ST_sed8]MDD1455950.1 Uma2 family endonuclease [Dolic